MKRFIALFYTFILFIGLSLTAAHAADLELVINDVSCVAEEEVLIRYGVINSKNFDLPNVSILFKIMVDGKPEACKEIKTLVPSGADGSEISETNINIPCKGKNVSLKYAIFNTSRRYRIIEWLSGCPGS